MSRQRSRSRSLAIQALYQWQMAGQDVGAIINHFMIEQDAKKFDTDYFSELVRGVPARLGELDLIMRDDDHLVFVEVRYRSHAAWGGAAASVDARKQARLIRAAEQFLQQHPALARLACRFDVVALDGEQPPDWLQGAFTG